MSQPRGPSKSSSQRLMLGLLGLSVVMMVVLLMNSLQRPARDDTPQSGEPLARLGLLPDATREAGRAAEEATPAP